MNENAGRYAFEVTAETLSAVAEAQYLTHALRQFRQHIELSVDLRSVTLKLREVSSFLPAILQEIYSRHDALDRLLIEANQVDVLAEFYPDGGVEYGNAPYRCFSEAALAAGKTICLMLHISHPDTNRASRPEDVRRGTSNPYPQMDSSKAIENHWKAMYLDPLTEMGLLQRLQVLLSAERRKVEKAESAPKPVGRLGKTMHVIDSESGIHLHGMPIPPRYLDSSGHPNGPVIGTKTELGATLHIDSIGKPVKTLQNWFNKAVETKRVFARQSEEPRNFELYYQSPALFRDAKLRLDAFRNATKRHGTKRDETERNTNNELS